MDFYRGPKTLHLPNVSIAGYVPIEDVLDARLLAGCEPLAAREEVFYERIPRTYRGNASWPISTAIPCWQCNATHSNIPRTTAPSIREVEGVLEFDTEGFMCSFNCAELYIEIKYRNSERLWGMQGNLLLLYFVMTGRSVDRILPAPFHTERRLYGGELDDEVFWRKLRDLDPVAGICDHTPGSVIPERQRPPMPEGERGRAALSVFQQRRGARPAVRTVSLTQPGIAKWDGLSVSPQSAWAACGLAPATASHAAAPASAGETDIDKLIAGLSTHPSDVDPTDIWEVLGGPISAADVAANSSEGSTDMVAEFAELFGDAPAAEGLAGAGAEAGETNDDTSTPFTDDDLAALFD